MKICIAALAALASAGTFAQSRVTLSGLVDTAATYVTTEVAGAKPMAIGTKASRSSGQVAVMGRGVCLEVVMAATLPSRTDTPLRRPRRLWTAGRSGCLWTPCGLRQCRV